MGTIVAVGTLLGGVSTYLSFRDSRSDDPSPSGSTSTTMSVQIGTGVGSPGPAAAPGTPGVVRADGAVLGREVAPLASETCRVPTFASGAEWQRASVKVGETTFETGYSCQLFSRATGTLDFDLGGRYRELRVTIGFGSDSGSLDHRVRFEVIGDGRFQLLDRTVRFGEIAPLTLDVSGISRLKLRLTEIGGSAADTAPSRPVWANPALT